MIHRKPRVNKLAELNIINSRKSSYRTVGHVERDGTVRDSNYRTIGHMKDVPSTYAAALFFFFGLL